MRPASSTARLCLVAVACLLCSRAMGQRIPRGALDRFERIIINREIKESAIPPEWFDSKAKPIFRFVQVSDIHFHPGLEPLLVRAIDYINTQVKPVFVAITGDNSGHSSIERQQYFKELFDKHLLPPYYIVRGDNWARNFSKVFGSTRYAFECGGIRFLFTGLDHDHEGSGMGTFANDTWEWMTRETKTEDETPVILLMHENVQPPDFLDAMRLDRLLESSPSVAGTMTGHLHPDVEFQAGRVKHILAPSFGRHRGHGFKVCEVHERLIVIRTVEWQDGAFRLVPKYQKIDLPYAVRPSGEIAVENYRELPPRETTFDVRIEDALPPIVLQCSIFAYKVGMAAELMQPITEDRKEHVRTH